MARIVTDENLKDVLNEDKPIVLDFGAEWCGPCRAVAPFIDELAIEYEGKVIVGKINVDDNDETTTQFGVRNIPTVLFIKDKQVLDKIVGATNKAAYAEKIEKLLS
ncbi:MAG: thioredoxin [Tannerella sp.]|jgi:thioredoxin 1|nr:thioredoxin [Tannerella sp.]